jgi:hypothetical protein
MTSEERWHEKQARKMNKRSTGEILGTRLDEFNWGFFVIQKFFWTMNLAVLVKVYGIPLYFQLIAVPVILIGTWLLGFTIQKTGIKKAFVNNYFKGSKMENKGE